MKDNPPKPLRVGIWAAVSTKPQAGPDMASLPDQERLGREFAAAVGGQVVATYLVPGHTRRYIFLQDACQEMDAYSRLVDDVAAGRINCLWVFDENRLGRTLALIAQVAAVVEQGGAELYVHTSPHVLGQPTASHLILTGVKGAFAEQEMNLFRYKHKSGMRGRVLKRGLHAGTWPVGYTAVRDASGKVSGAELNDQAETVRTMTALFLAGHSYREIVARLNEMGLPAAHGGRWSLSSVQQTMRNPTYSGRLLWGGEIGEPSTRFPALWDADTYEAVIREQQRRARGPYTRSGGGPYTGVAFCQRCGRRMYRLTVHAARNHYLVCGLHQGIERGACHSNHLPEWKVTEALTETFAEMSRNPALLDAALEAGGAGSTEQQVREDLERSRRLIADLEGRRVVLGHALAAGQMKPAVYATVDGQLEAQLDAERSKAADLRRALAAMPDMGARREVLAALARDYGQVVEALPAATVAAMLQQAGVRIYCEEGKVTRVAVGG